MRERFSDKAKERMTRQRHRQELCYSTAAKIFPTVLLKETCASPVSPFCLKEAPMRYDVSLLIKLVQGVVFLGMSSMLGLTLLSLFVFIQRSRSAGGNKDSLSLKDNVKWKRNAEKTQKTAEHDLYHPYNYSSPMDVELLKSACFRPGDTKCICCVCILTLYWFAPRLYQPVILHMGSVM